MAKSEWEEFVSTYPADENDNLRKLLDEAGPAVVSVERECKNVCHVLDRLWKRAE